jgi:hypothetical protein
MIIVNPHFNLLENKLVIKENKKIQGRYEIIALPGKYILEVNKKGYDVSILELTFR